MNFKKIIALALAAAMILGTLASCAAGIEDFIKDDGSFDFSKGLDENGRFKGVTAQNFIKLPDYESYTMPENLLTASRDEVERQFETIRRNFTTREEDPDNTRRIADGDEVNIDYVGTIDGEEFEGGSTSGNGTDVIIGTTGYIDGFLEQLIGHRPGEKFDINVTFPEGYDNRDLAGKDAVFHITINHYYKEIVPEIDDRFVKENYRGTFENLEELTRRVEERIVDNNTKSYLWNLLAGESEITDYPEKVMNYEKAYNLRNMRRTAESYSMEVRDLLSRMGFESEDEFIESIDRDIKEAVKADCIIQAICEKEGLKVDEDALAEYFEKYYGDPDYSRYREHYGENYLKFIASQELVFDSIIARMPTGPRQDDRDNRDDGRDSRRTTEE